MSQHHYPYGYGQNQNQPPQQPYSYQNPLSYAAPTQNSPHDPAAGDRGRFVSQSAFDLNASHIPGLGIAGTPPAGNLYPVAPGSGAWAQSPAFGANPQAGAQPKLAPSGAPKHISKPQVQPIALAAHAALNSDVEEGELSEGQFEDLYEPQESARPAYSVQKAPKSPSEVNQSVPASAAETPDAAFYGIDEDEGEASARDKSEVVAGRERSGSYSPFLSPREIQNDNPAPVANAEVSENLVVPPQKNIGQAVSIVPGLKYTSQQSSNPSGSGQPSAPISQPTEKITKFKSLLEAKKDAQKAILYLWPMGVKYQTYLDEGFDEKVIKSLFEDLRLDMTQKPSEARVKSDTQPPQGATSTLLKSLSATVVPNQKLVSHDKDSSSTADQMKKGEERKDRIARLLAAKAAKAPVAPNTKPVPPQAKQTATQEKPQDPAVNPLAQSRSKIWGEKELLIKQKMLALQKAREAQAEKSAGEKPVSDIAQQSKTPAIAQTSQRTVPVVGSITPSLRVETCQTAQVPSNPPQPISSIPGLLLSAAQPGQPSNQRKRPVASDFVDYSSTVGPPKRPFGQERKEASLVIDVSDGSDYEEMDMDMGSPVDDSSLYQTTSMATQRGPLIRDFPPLTDTLSQRQFSSPAPSSNTPPGGLLNGKRRETELDIKEKEIQDLRRKIAEAEAKKKTAKKASVSSHNPTTTSATDSKDHEVAQPHSTQRMVSVSGSEKSDGPSAQLISEETSAKLPKPSEITRLGKEEKAQRRGRIVSLDLPRIDESLEDKVKRLNELRDEESRLQREIDERLAEKRLLTAELEQLNDTPSEGTPQSNELESGNPSDLPASRGDGAFFGSQAVSSESSSKASDHSDGTSDVSMDEDESSGSSSQRQTPCQEGSPLQQSVIANAVQTRPDSPPAIDNSASNESRGPSPAKMDNSSNPQNATVSPLSVVGVDDAVDGASDASPMDTPASEAAGGIDVSASELHLPADPERFDDTTPMELESSPSSPAATQAIGDSLAGDGTLTRRQSSAPLLEQISSVAETREEVQEIETTAAREVDNVLVPRSDPEFKPYESPLRYFHAYRFHPNYREVVGGGLKSLTYSNKIDPLQPICPFELSGEQCPEKCQFQHLKSVRALDEQILLELGKADEYSGERKARFIQGLRELLHGFRVNRVKDFETIANGIIEFRSRFLADKSKVLRLDGVII
ncbi:hypothetical protein B0T22DRAFT_46210 [Podospora appendiculata]|uniref:Putative zinc-finger domain-containing protein n=1 Tax=Podospora appendiculata TaxID=314037 RepID=A0AAE0XHP7_9PEZI|nr:hypothetical protein B0T22DRAFT_46210 [Podospora appendiculata]